MKVCKRQSCDETFYPYNKVQVYCSKPCQRQDSKERYGDKYLIKKIANKAHFVNHYGAECVKCGFNQYLEALTFHHTDPSNKEASPSDLIAKNRYELIEERSIVLKELDKCILVCHNCHAREHSHYPDDWQSL